jgi:methyl-accepting chemotaxis protein
MKTNSGTRFFRSWVPATKRDLEQMEKRIMDTLQTLSDALNKIDAATTKSAGNIQTISSSLTTVAATTQTISDEVDELEAALKNAGVPQNLIDQASALGDKAQAASDALDAVVPALNAHADFLTQIASKGATNPVPVPPPPAPTPPA